jgi:hypothetical protein
MDFNFVDVGSQAVCIPNLEYALLMAGEMGSTTYVTIRLRYLHPITISPTLRIITLLTRLSHPRLIPTSLHLRLHPNYLLPLLLHLILHLPIHFPLPLIIRSFKY